MKTIQIEVINKLGLHARAAAKFVNTASAYASTVNICKDGNNVDGKSIMAVMMLAATKGSQLQISFDGNDEEVAAEAICTLINNRFDEDE